MSPIDMIVGLFVAALPLVVLAIPATIAAQYAFPERERIVVVAFPVALGALGGFTPPPAVRYLQLDQDETRSTQVRESMIPGSE